MSTSLYDLSVGCYVQTLGGIAGCLERGAKHFAEKGVDPNEIVETRLFPDMLPFRFQVQAVAHHSLGTIEAIKAGTFLPPSNMPAHDYKGLQALITETAAALKKLTPADVNALGGRDIIFQMRELKLPFTAEGFVMSFSLPNFHFHATTTYDILRTKGVPLGKRDYMGQLRMKGMA